MIWDTVNLPGNSLIILKFCAYTLLGRTRRAFTLRLILQNHRSKTFLNSLSDTSMNYEVFHIFFCVILVHCSLQSFWMAFSPLLCSFFSSISYSAKESQGFLFRPLEQARALSLSLMWSSPSCPLPRSFSYHSCLIFSPYELQLSLCL